MISLVLVAVEPSAAALRKLIFGLRGRYALLKNMPGLGPVCGAVMAQRRAGMRPGMDVYWYERDTAMGIIVLLGMTIVLQLMAAVLVLRSSGSRPSNVQGGCCLPWRLYCWPYNAASSSYG